MKKNRFHADEVRTHETDLAAGYCGCSDALNTGCCDHLMAQAQEVAHV